MAVTKESLNRTMQYGNPNNFSYCVFNMVSLNRTMQYGNNILIV